MFLLVYIIMSAMSYLFLLISGCRTVWPEEVLLIQIFALDVSRLLLSLVFLFVRRSPELLNIQPAHEVHAEKTDTM